MPPVLFSPIALRGVTLANRIVVSPLSQFCGEDGRMNDWHLMHLGNFAVSGAGLVMTEVIYVEPRGRVGPGCIGLYDDACEAALARVHDFCRRWGHSRMGIQLGHAGRKASIQPPWLGRDWIPPEAGGWGTIGPSAITMGPPYPVPHAVSREEISGLVEAFAAATRRAARIGFDVLEIHAAHGYLFHQFLSPQSNTREDAYGGSAENRRRFLLEAFEAMRAEWPADRPMGVRLSAVDWATVGVTLPETVGTASALAALGCDFIVATSGGLASDCPIPVEPGYQVPFAQAIREGASIATTAVGMITEPLHAEEIVATGRADLVALGRGMMYDPRWAWRAADALGGCDVSYPVQYDRARPAGRLADAGNWTVATREVSRVADAS
jgi:2,4-dienoyl-CoA reductase-like NADH-dependent reductase (Old Yellow Enzyme family)